MDSIDRKILSLIQDDASLSLNEMAERIGLSTTPLWRRIKALEEAGIIRKRVALLCPEALGLDVTVFVTVKTDQHNDEWLSHFAQSVNEMPEVTEFYRMSGDRDYLLKVIVRDIRSYDAFYKRLIALGGLSDVSSTFSMEQVKYTTALPVETPPKTQR